jgi:pimeloyl-ACP methyl ester carboxylesterase
MSTPAAFRMAMALLSELAPSAAESVAARLWMSPRKNLRPARELAWLEQGAPITFSTSRAELAAWSWGRGPTVLLVHGWAGRGAQLGAFVQPLVESGHRVVAFDAPAHGSSGGDRVNLADFAEAVEEAAWAFGPLKGVVAHSFGCVATCAAMLQGVPVERLVFVAPAVMTQQANKQMRELLGVNGAVMKRLTDRVEERMSVSLSDLDAQGIGQIARPLLAFHAPDDREVPVERALLLQRFWPGAQLVMRPGAGHSFILRDPDVVSQATSFLVHGGRALNQPQDAWTHLVGPRVA